MLGDGVSRQSASDYFVIVSWGELTSSQLIAQSYELGASKRPLITKPIAYLTINSYSNPLRLQ